VKRRLALLLHFVLVVAGLLPVLYLVVLVTWPASALFRGHSPLVAAVLALAGIVITAAGMFGFVRQRARIDLEKQREEDRLRRVREYRRDESLSEIYDGRREPYIGAGGEYTPKVDRRVA
jgi:hypothetical protein